MQLRFIITTLALLASLTASPAVPASQNLIRPGEVWNDTDGKPINAHGGGILFHQSVYYWYGEIKEGRTYTPFPGGGNRVVAGGVSYYRCSGKPVIEWKNEWTPVPMGESKLTSMLTK